MLKMKDFDSDTHDMPEQGPDDEDDDHPPVLVIVPSPSVPIVILEQSSPNYALHQRSQLPGYEPYSVADLPM